MNEVAEKVVREAADMLDQVETGWWMRGVVNLDTLDIGSGRDCLLAQVFGEGSYFVGTDELKALLNEFEHRSRFLDSYTLTGKFGFRAAVLADGTYLTSPELTLAWIKVILERRRT